MAIWCFGRTQRAKEELQHYLAERHDYKIAALLERAIFKWHTIPLGKPIDFIVMVHEDDVWRCMDEGERAAPIERIEETLRNALRELLCPGETLGNVYVSMVWNDELEKDNVAGLNNCFFKTERIIEHDDLRFRSNAEIAIYDELARRRMLFFPNAAAVLGGRKREKREPDFLICERGKWGILEVMGDAYHKNAAKDHERARLFKDAGVLCVEFFTAGDCEFDPRAVVDRFLAILRQH